MHGGRYVRQFQTDVLPMHPYCIDISSTFHHSNKQKALCTIYYFSPGLAETKPSLETCQSRGSITVVHICSNWPTYHPIFLYSVMPCCALGSCLVYAISKLKRGSSSVGLYKLFLDSAETRISCLHLKRLYKLSIFSCPCSWSSWECFIFSC